MMPQAADRTIDLDAYFRRIGHGGTRTPTLETLLALHLRHTEAIAFENLNPLLGWPVRLDVPALQRKLVCEGRGGYCFEHNLLFGHVLTALGFSVTGLAARVLWNRPEDAITPRGHMLLRVDINGEPHIADVGFGGQTLTAPLRLAADVVQATPHEPFRLLRSGSEFRMQCRIGETWKSLYRFDLQEQLAVDYEVTNYYLSTHEESHFRNSLFVARPAAGCRYALHDAQFAVHHLNGPTERRTLTGIAEIRRTLEDVFRLTLPRTPELDAALARFATAAP